MNKSTYFSFAAVVASLITTVNACDLTVVQIDNPANTTHAKLDGNKACTNKNVILTKKGKWAYGKNMPSKGTNVFVDQKGRAVPYRYSLMWGKCIINFHTSDTFYSLDLDKYDSNLGFSPDLCIRVAPQWTSIVQKPNGDRKSVV